MVDTPKPVTSQVCDTMWHGSKPEALSPGHANYFTQYIRKEIVGSSSYQSQIKKIVKTANVSEDVALKTIPFISWHSEDREGSIVIALDGKYHPIQLKGDLKKKVKGLFSQSTKKIQSDSSNDQAVKKTFKDHLDDFRRKHCLPSDPSTETEETSNLSSLLRPATKTNPPSSSSSPSSSLSSLLRSATKTNTPLSSSPSPGSLSSLLTSASAPARHVAATSPNLLSRLWKRFARSPATTVPPPPITPTITTPLLSSFLRSSPAATSSIPQAPPPATPTITTPTLSSLLRSSPAATPPKLVPSISPRRDPPTREAPIAPVALTSPEASTLPLPPPGFFLSTHNPSAKPATLFGKRRNPIRQSSTAKTRLSKKRTRQVPLQTGERSDKTKESYPLQGQEGFSLREQRNRESFKLIAQQLLHQETTNHRLSSEIGTLTREVSVLRKQNNRLIADLNQEKRALEEILSRYSTTINDLQQNLKRLVEIIETSKEESTKEKAETKEAYLKEMQVKQHEIAALQANLSQMALQISQISKTSGGYAGQAEKLQQQLIANSSKFEDQISQLSEANQDLKTDLIEQSEALLKIAEEYNNTINKQNRQLHEQSEKLQEFQQALHSLQRENRGLKAKTSEEAEALLTITNAISEMQNN